MIHILIVCACVFSAEPHIAEALVQMKAMGFTDDCGGLTRLLIEKKGSITDTLDMIQTSRAKQHDPKP